MQEIAVERTNNRGDTRSVATQAVGATPERCVLSVDCSERNAVLLDLARRCDEFDVRIEHLVVGDYFIAGEFSSSGKPTRISQSPSPMADCFLKPPRSLEVPIDLWSCSRAHDHSRCPTSIHMRSKGHSFRWQ